MGSRQAGSMHRKPLAAVIVLAAVLGAVIAGAGAAYADPGSPTATPNRGWDVPSPDAIARTDR